MAYWQVIRAEDKTVIHPNLLMGEEDARQYAVILAGETGKIDFARPAPDLQWKEREALRFMTGAYQELPWCDEIWWLERSEDYRFHFAHMSKEKDSMVAYTESPEKGEADRQTRCKAGVYLTRYFSDVLTPNEIQTWVRIFHGERDDSPVAFSLALAPDEIEHVYSNGPASCMAGDSFYDGDEHPVRVYGNSDLAVAYIEKPSDYHDNPIASRAIVWPEKKLYGRIYPTPERYDSGYKREAANREHDRLLRALKRDGYSQGDFSGAHIRAIEGPKSESYLMPYLDGGYKVSLVMRDGEDFFRLGHRGEYCASDTNGVLYLRGRFICERCEDQCDEDDTYSVNISRHGSESWCSHCYENHTFYCNGYDESYSEDVDSVEGPNGNTYSLYYAETHFGFCERDEVWVSPDEIGPVWTSETNQESWGEHARDNFAFYCAGTDSYYESDSFESVEIDGETYWKKHAEGDLILRAKLVEESETETETVEG